MDSMVLEKQDSGISLSMVGVEGHDAGKMSEALSTEHLHNGHTNELTQHANELTHHELCPEHQGQVSGDTVAPSGEDVHVPLHKTVCCSLCRKKQERQEKLRRADRGAHLGSQDSITDASSITSSRASRPWIRDPLADVQPIKDPVLRQKIQGFGASGGRLNSRSATPSVDGTLNQRRSAPVMRTSDQKILQLMIAKREAERKQQETRESARSKWEADKQREAATRNAAQNRRRTLSEKKKATSSLSCLHHRTGSDAPCSCGRNHDRQVDPPTRASRESLSRHGGSNTHSPVQENGDSRRSWVMASQRRQELQKQQMQEKKMRELERQKSVEKRLEEQKKENEDYQRKLLEKQRRDMEKADMVRSSHEQQKELTRKLKSYQAEQRYKDKTDVLKRQSMEDLVAMRASIDLRGHLSTGKHKELNSRKQNESKRRSLDLDHKLKQYKANKTKMDEDLQHWHEDLLQYRQSQEKRAEVLAKQQALARAKRAQEERIAKQKLQKENMKKLLGAEEEWKMEVEATIALKDSKSKMLQREKEEIIQQSRAMAQATQRLREDLRQHYSLNDLDKLNRQAELEARLSTRTMESATANLARLNTDP